MAEASTEREQGSAPEHQPLAREGEHVPPTFEAGAYHRPHCGVLATMSWSQLVYKLSNSLIHTDSWHVLCSNCREAQYWVADSRGEPRMARPDVGGGPRAHVDMPDDVRADYDEARSILYRSPRGACALLRLATQKLVNDHLQPTGGDLNDRIRLLVEHGLPPMVQQALDALRVIGNEAVHPGELDLRDDAETANGLFMLMNVIVEDRIARPKQVAEMYSKLPAGKLQGIVNRDQRTEQP
jgi:hypothetical protein